MQSCLPDDHRVVTPTFRQLHSNDAVVTEIQNLMLEDEARYIVKAADTVGWNNSTVVTKNGGSEPDARRTSQTAFLPKDEDRVLECISRRIATLATQPATHMEPMQVTHYKNKQEYKQHHDYFNRPNEPERTTTVFAYLHSQACDTGKCGGATMFHELKQPSGEPLKVYPRIGNAVMWSNRTSDGKVNSKTLHSGEKLQCENADKIGLNVWFRDQPWA